MPVSVNDLDSNVIIIRESTSKNGTFSSVSVTTPDTTLMFSGVEKPWRDNKPFVSCIPSGIYVGIPWESSKFGNVYGIVGGTVSLTKGNAERYACLFHVGNYEKDVSGCIALGRGSAPNMVTNSRDAMNMFREIIGDNLFRIDIRWID